MGSYLSKTKRKEWFALTSKILFALRCIRFMFTKHRSGIKKNIMKLYLMKLFIINTFYNEVDLAKAQFW